ncbi:MAG: carboxylating nicotinate-nucleotide diphosphorylase [Nitrospira sp.]
MTPALSRAIHAAVKLALAEDLRHGDVTTSALFPRPVRARGTILAHQPLTIAGVAVATQVFWAVDSSLRIIGAVRDGDTVRRNQPVIIVRGDARSLLKAERVALNFLQRLSGIATLTARFCDAVRGSRANIMDTRKTTPGLRALEKWAVSLGGGHNHRYSLGSGVLIKDNHLALSGHDAAAACQRARKRNPQLQIEVEAKTLREVQSALSGNADIILLDNMTVPTMHRAIKLIGKRARVEVSGGITLANVRKIAALKPHRISIGALTHSAPAANLSMDIALIR